MGKKKSTYKINCDVKKIWSTRCRIAGLSKASVEYIGVIDADLQDPPEILL